MNFLAHAYLSGNDPFILVGNMIADFVKGKQFAAYIPEVQRGILIHREIDRYTDQHPIVKESRRLFYPEIRHYALVITDVIYDHYLGKHWHKYHSQPLKLFTGKVYDTLEQNSSLLPADFNVILPRMKTHDWLASYADTQGIFRSLDGLARRSPGFVFAGKTKELFLHHYDTLHEHFNQFFPELIHHTEIKKATP